MLQLFEYELPFQNLFKTGAGSFRNRKGVVLHYRERNHDFVAEASPLPGFSIESLEKVKTTLVDQTKWINEFLQQDFSIRSIFNLVDEQNLSAPSIQFALSFMGLSIAAKRRETSLSDILGKNNAGKFLFFNDVIGHTSPDVMQHQIESSIQKGFKVLKIKSLYPLGKLPSLLDTIYKKYPHIRFRLDANQSWPKNKLNQIFQLLNDLPIEYIEEPCKLEDLSELKEIHSDSTHPIALDESISSVKELERALHSYPDLFIVIKPMLLGNILEIRETISRYRSSFKKIVVTTTLESMIGRSMTASAAYLIGDLKLSHGLNTGDLLAYDLLPDFEIKNGSIRKPQVQLLTDSFSQIKTSYLKKL